MPLPKKLEPSVLSCENKVVAHRYMVVKRIGSGSFGTVFLVTDSKAGNDKKVLKQIFVGELLPDDTVDAVREAKLLSKLAHPSIVHFNDSFLEGESFCIVTEFCEGGDLDGKIRAWKESNKMFEESLILDWFVQLTDAIRYIHDRRILHRDIKTRNIFLKNNYIKLGDFGISKILMGTTDLATTVTGTPYYMSPEVLKHEGYNSKSDIWSLGAVLYELCMLERAFQGKSLVGVMYRIIEEEPPPLAQSFHPLFRSLLTRMLNKDPKQRPSAREILLNEHIQAHIKGLSEKMTTKKTVNDQVRSSEDHEAIAKALIPTKKKHLSSSSNGSQSIHLTPKQLLAQKKQEKADEEAELRRKLAAENFKDRRKRYSERKMKEARIRPPWVEEHPEVFDNNFSLTDNSISPETMHDQSLLQSRDSKEEKIEATMETSALESMDIPEQHREAWTGSDDIPEDPLLAETHYSQFEDFEDDDVIVSDSEDEYDAFIECIENALHIEEQDPKSKWSEVKDWDNVPISPVGPVARDFKIKALRNQCEKIFGKESFLRAYKYLKDAREQGCYEEEGKVMFGLREIVGNVRDCFLIDQLIFLEKQ